MVLRRANFRLRLNLDVFRAGFRYATKAYVVALLGFLLLRANVFLLERLAGAAELGQYSIAAQIGDVLTVLPSSVALVLFPRLVAEEEVRWTMLLRNVKMTAFLIVAICVFSAIVVSPVIRLVFGAEFAAAVPMLLFLLPGIVLLAVSTILSQYLAARGLPVGLVGVWAAALATGVVGSLLLIPSAGGVGASIGLSGAYAVLLIGVVALTVMERNRELMPGGFQQKPA